MSYSHDRFESVSQTLLPDKIRKIYSVKPHTVIKGWGKEVQIANEFSTTDGYSGKLLVYEKQWAMSSMHFHTRKHETFYILNGNFTLRYYNPENADILEMDMIQGDGVIIPPFNPHQVICNIPKGTIIEFASTDYTWDNYRIGKGDSQQKSKILQEPGE